LADKQPTEKMAYYMSVETHHKHSVHQPHENYGWRHDRFRHSKHGMKPHKNCNKES